MRGDFALKVRRGFTLIELIISMAIIGLLIALIIPNIDRSLSKNSVANDAELFKAKLEEVRLMSGSTQLVDESNGSSGSIATDKAGYYAIVLLTGNRSYFNVVRVSYPMTDPSADCRISQVFLHINEQKGACLVQRIQLSQGVTMSGVTDTMMIAYKAPSQQLTMITNSSGWAERSPLFPDPLFQLTYQGKTATVNIDDYTGRVSVSY